MQTEQENTEQKSTLSSLARELKEKISKEEKEQRETKKKKSISKEKVISREDTSKSSISQELKSQKSKISEKLLGVLDKDREIQKASEKITKREVEKETKELKKTSSKEETLIPLEDYIKCAVHLGTKVITPHMRKYVYKRRADGLSVINTVAIDEKLRESIDFLIQYNPEQIYIACKREAGWNAVKKFHEVTGIRAFTKKYPPGITTNLKLEDFFEAELTIICDPWIDRNALVDTARLKKPVIALCDTNNFTTHITKIIPCNNKAKKSIGCILYILAREYCRAKDLPFTAELEDFAGGLE